MSVGRAVALRLLLFAISLTIFLATGELALRIVYRDQGARTLGGPGARPFEHLTVDGRNLRGRLDTGDKTPGKPRIMVLGDSITWGQGVHDWQDTWPERVARTLEQSGAPHEMAVLSLPGRNIPEHVAGLESWGQAVKPDVLIYQWYVNDIEVDPRRPDNIRWWQQLPWHGALLQWSYLYFFLESRLASYLPPPDRSYVEYILQDYAPGTLEWAEFERYFHRLAAQARELAPTRLLVIYPQVPFSGTSPLEPLQDRLTTLATTARQLSIPPAAWIRSAGASVDAPDAPWHQAVRVAADVRGPVIDTREYYVPASGLDVTLTTSCMPDERPFATLDAIDAVSNETRASIALDASGSQGAWCDVTAHVPRTPESPLVRLRVSAQGTAFSVANIALGIDYRFSVVDLTDDLNTFNTHASVFDAHPNERAHAVMADKIVNAIRQAEAASRH